MRRLCFHLELFLMLPLHYITEEKMRLSNSTQCIWVKDFTEWIIWPAFKIQQWLLHPSFMLHFNFNKWKVKKKKTADLCCRTLLLFCYISRPCHFPSGLLNKSVYELVQTSSTCRRHAKPNQDSHFAANTHLTWRQEHFSCRNFHLCVA